MYTVEKIAEYAPEALDAAAAALLAALEQEAAAVANDADWKVFRDRWMARKNGVLTQVNDTWLKGAPGAAKRDAGRRVNELKQAVEARVEQVHERLSASSGEARLAAERVDITLPGLRRAVGVEHPVIRTMNEVVTVFRNMGYSVGEGPEVESDYYNFESLNFPSDHPAL